MCMRVARSLGRSQHWHATDVALRNRKSWLPCLFGFGFCFSIRAKRTDETNKATANLQITRWGFGSRHCRRDFRIAKTETATRLQAFFELLALRNRIAHHEPIFKRILKVAKWISPITAEWIEQHCLVFEIPERIEFRSLNIVFGLRRFPESGMIRLNLQRYRHFSGNLWRRLHAQSG